MGTGQSISNQDVTARSTTLGCSTPEGDSERPQPGLDPQTVDDVHSPTHLPPLPFLMTCCRSCQSHRRARDQTRGPGSSQPVQQIKQTRHGINNFASGGTLSASAKFKFSVRSNDDMANRTLEWVFCSHVWGNDFGFCDGTSPQFTGASLTGHGNWCGLSDNSYPAVQGPNTAF